MRPGVLLVPLALAGSAALLARSRAEPLRHASPPSPDGNMVVTLCDGETSAEIPGVKEGAHPTRQQAQAVVDRLMGEWRRKHPEARWETAQADLGQGEPAAPAPPPAPVPVPEKSGPTGGGKAGGLPAVTEPEEQSGHTYGAFTERDEKIWAAETERFVKEGHRIFHDADAVGSANAVSCDMCHPDGANTHPETYPKFQVQLGRVALLRDMINWCIQNPTRGRPLPDDDMRLKALEAYILAQRKGVPLEFGKH
jgi:SoxA/TsdA, cytochrome c domain